MEPPAPSGHLGNDCRHPPACGGSREPEEKKTRRLAARPPHGSGPRHKLPIPPKRGTKPDLGRSASASLAKDGAVAAEGRSPPPGAGRRQMTSARRAKGAWGFPVLLSCGPPGWEAGAWGGAAGADGGSLGSPRLRAGAGGGRVHRPCGEEPPPGGEPGPHRGLVRGAAGRAGGAGGLAARDPAAGPAARRRQDLGAAGGRWEGRAQRQGTGGRGRGGKRRGRGHPDGAWGCVCARQGPPRPGRGVGPLRAGRSKKGWGKSASPGNRNGPALANRCVPGARVSPVVLTQA